MPDADLLSAGQPATAGAEALRVAMLPAANPLNRYNSLLATSLVQQGVVVRDVSPRPDQWLAAPAIDVVHTHWPENLMVRPCDGLERRVRGTAAAHGFRLTRRLARRHRVGFVHTLHNLRPHDPRATRAQTSLVRWIAQTADVLITHSEHTATVAVEQLRRSGPILVAEHGNYVGAYPPAAPRARDVVRARLGIPHAARVMLAFGQIRTNKQVPEVFRAARTADPDLWLLVAGKPGDPAAVQEVRALAESHPRVVLLDDHVADEDVAGLFAAADVSLHGQREIFTSGAIILALSMGVPAIAPSAGSTQELAGEPALFLHDGDVAAATRRWLTADPAAASAAALAAAEALSWDRSAAVHRAAYALACDISALRRRGRKG